LRPQPASASAAAARKTSPHLVETELDVLFTAISPIGDTIQRMLYSGEAGSPENSSVTGLEVRFIVPRIHQMNF
jgi:hypothetical protein